MVWDIMPCMIISRVTNQNHEIVKIVEKKDFLIWQTSARNTKEFLVIGNGSVVLVT